jgi:anti-anti-sigma regulatory factor
MATLLRTEGDPFYIELLHVLHVSNHRSLRATIAAAMDRGVSHVVVDCAGWERLDLSVLSSLVQGANACGLRGVTFELVNLERELHADITALRLGTKLGLYA